MKNKAKRVFTFLLIVIMAFSLISCSKEKTDDKNAGDKTTLSLNDTVAMSINRVKNADYSPKIVSMITGDTSINVAQTSSSLNGVVKNMATVSGTTYDKTELHDGEFFPIPRIE